MSPVSKSEFHGFGDGVSRRSLRNHLPRFRPRCPWDTRRRKTPCRLPRQACQRGSCQRRRTWGPRMTILTGSGCWGSFACRDLWPAVPGRELVGGGLRSPVVLLTVGVLPPPYRRETVCVTVTSKVRVTEIDAIAILDRNQDCGGIVDDPLSGAFVRKYSRSNDGVG